MKKKPNHEILFFLWKRRKILLTMKLLLCFILFSMLNVSGSIFSQSAKFDLAVNGKTVKEVFKDIENQSDFRFLYNDDFAGLSRVVSFNTKDNNIDEVLSELLAGANLTYRELENELIVITPMEVAVQQRTVSGIVTDQNNEPLPGVTIMVKGTTIGTVTDSDGNFTVTNVPDDAVLVFSFVGMQTQEVLVEDRNRIDISMNIESIGLDEVVAIGYGTQTRANVIGSVTSVRSQDLTSAPVGRVSNALAGRLPGGIFMQESGEPGGDAPTIRIRGNATLGNNNPLVVVDGIAGRDINSLHPNDIESITVLKDASAAIYGARAANGVILITTKRGNTDTPPTFTYGFYEGFLSPTMLPEMADAPTYARMIRENQSYRGVDESNMMFSLEDIEKYESGEYPWTHPNTNWFDAALRDYSSTRHHNFAVDGGTGAVNYYGSFGSQFDDGIFVNNNTSYNRYNLRGNIDVKVNDYLNVGLDLAGIQENRMYPTNSEGNIFQTLIRIYPTFPALFPNGLPGPDLEYGDQPMVMASEQTGFDDDKRYRSNNIISADLKIPGVEGLLLSGYYAYDMYIQQRKRFEKPWTLYSLDESSYFAAGNTGREDGSDFLIATTKGPAEPRLRDYSANSTSKTANIRLSYVKTFNEVHNVNVFAAYEYNDFHHEGFNAYRRYFLSDRLPYLFAGGDDQKDNDGWVELDARQNYFGRLSYDYEG
ncbi:MAG: SusC/RagA family TonB-linked outer membrane protein, partial [Bacteroidales bacterium]